MRLKDIREPIMREDFIASSFDNAKRELVLQLVPSDGKGEVRAEAFEVRFPDLRCASQGECLEAATSQLFGWKDEVKNVEHDAAYLAARDRALAQLKALERPFRKGLPGEEVLLVKARFPHAEGNEWMWVEVLSWKKGTFSGRLQSQPQYVTGIRPGATVEVSFEDVADYMHKLGDGTFRGNETGKVFHPELFEDLGDGRSRLRE